jgi:ABC-2 type transport system ATP-binding protein
MSSRSSSREGTVVDAVIETTNLTKRYGHTTALKDCSLSVHAGEVMGFLGPNGAGKSTMINVLLGFARPTSGIATIFGENCTTRAARIHRRLAAVPSDVTLWPSLTGGETLDLFANLHETVDPTYRDVLVDRFALDPTVKVRAYSNGNRQKVLLIGALMTRADLLILDEPTTGLDPLMEQAFRSSILEAADRGQTVFLSSHIMSEVEALCDRVAILRSGALIDVGTLHDLHHLGGRHMDVRFNGIVPDLSRIPGVSNFTVQANRARFEVRGDLHPILDALAASDVLGLDVREPSLEEIFLAHYGDES